MNNANPLIREADPDDFAQLMELYRQLNSDDPASSSESERIVFDEILKNPGLHLFVLENLSGLVCATCYLNVIPNITRQASPYGIIENVVTDAGYRKRGFGKEIVRHALQTAWNVGCYKVMLQTGSKRESTHQFYKGCGFIAQGRFAFVARPS